MAAHPPEDARCFAPEDVRWMRLALRLGRRGLGRVAPNPAVGCVLVRNGRVVGRGWTQSGGRPHAETVALAQAGQGAMGATAYVTLEPCSHHGETPPCADALVAAGVIRVVGALRDPDPRVKGRGYQRLRAAGIMVTEDVGTADAAAANAGFLARVQRGRPMVTLKLATTIDSRIATRDGESQWITGAPARRMVHLMRARHDAVLTGIGTVLADDPALTCRLSGLRARSPLRVVLDSTLKTPASSVLAITARDIKTMIITTARALDAAAAPLRDKCVEIVRVTPADDGRVEPAAALASLAERGITRVFLESGGQLAASFLRLDLVDELVWFRAPMLIGGDGRSALEALGVQSLSLAPGFERVEVRPVGEDVVETYRRRP